MILFSLYSWNYHLIWIVFFFVQCSSTDVTWLAFQSKWFRYVCKELFDSRWLVDFFSSHFLFRNWVYRAAIEISNAKQNSTVQYESVAAVCLRHVSSMFCLCAYQRTITKCGEPNETRRNICIISTVFKIDAQQLDSNFKFHPNDIKSIWVWAEHKIFLTFRHIMLHFVGICSALFANWCGCANSTLTPIEREPSNTGTPKREKNKRYIERRNWSKKISFISHNSWMELFC